MTHCWAKTSNHIRNIMLLTIWYSFIQKRRNKWNKRNLNLLHLDISALYKYENRRFYNSHENKLNHSPTGQSKSNTCTIHIKRTALAACLLGWFMGLAKLDLFFYIACAETNFLGSNVSISFNYSKNHIKQIRRRHSLGFHFIERTSLIISSYT